MKSRTSYFDKTIFLKNLTRFAPAWGLYTVGALLGLVLLLDSGSHWIANNLVEITQIMCLITPCYALLCALSALIFLLGTNLQFAFFFGLAVLSAFCVGSRFAQAVVYGIVNFAALIAGWFIDTLYIPQFYGIRMEIQSFYPFSPIANMMDKPFVNAEQIFDTAGVAYREVIDYRYQVGEAFVYYFLAAALGLVLLLAALELYRRRKLECAGDFIAVKVLEPLFLVIYTLVAGSSFHYIISDLFYMGTPLFLFAGLAVGWFTGKMLLERSTRVFSRKSFLGCGALMTAFALTLGLAAWDPLGIETWVPEVEEVESVTLSDGYYYSSKYRPDFTVLEDPEDIAQIIAIHTDALTHYPQQTPPQATFEDVYGELVLDAKEEEDPLDLWYSFVLTYRLNSGRTVSRYYDVWMKAESSAYLLDLLNSPEVVFGYPVTEADFLAQYRSCTIRDTWEGYETLVHSQADLQSLYRAILADCEAGTMVQEYAFHRNRDQVYWLDFGNGLEIYVFEDARNTLNWLRDHGLDVDDLLERREKIYN